MRSFSPLEVILKCHYLVPNVSRRCPEGVPKVSRLSRKALRQSNAQFCSVEVLQRLAVKLRSDRAERGDRAVGWDVFLLDYAIDSPLHATRKDIIVTCHMSSHVITCHHMSSHVITIRNQITC